jgi:hypothetical protein
MSGGLGSIEFGYPAALGAWAAARSAGLAVTATVASASTAPND